MSEYKMYLQVITLFDEEHLALGDYIINEDTGELTEIFDFINQRLDGSDITEEIEMEIEMYEYNQSFFFNQPSLEKMIKTYKEEGNTIILGAMVEVFIRMIAYFYDEDFMYHYNMDRDDVAWLKYVDIDDLPWLSEKYFNAPESLE